MCGCVTVGACMWYVKEMCMLWPRRGRKGGKERKEGGEGGEGVGPDKI